MPKLIKTKQRRLTIRLEDKIMDRIQEEKDRTSSTLSAVVCKALQSYFGLTSV